MLGRVRLYGREPLLHSFVPRLTGLAYGQRARVRWKPHPDPPVVLLTGQHGMGRSAVLDDLDAEYRGRLPFAYVRAVPADGHTSALPRQDAPPHTAASVVELLQELVCGLAPELLSQGLLRRHPFRLLLPGLFAVSAWPPGDDDERGRACRRLARMLIACGLSKTDPETLAGILARDLEEACAGDAGAGDAGEDRQKLTAAVVAKYAEMGPTAPAQTWYGEQQGRVTSPRPDGPATLERLGMRLHRGGDPRRAAERTLVAAFLHDIAAAYGPLQRANRERRPLILLDDAHHPAGRGFIDLLLEDRARQERPHDDHLVLIATQLGGTPEEAPDAVEYALPELTGATAKSGWRRRGHAPSAGLLVAPLTPLSSEDVLSFLDGTDAQLHPYLASSVHALTGGHPEASSMLCAAVLDATTRKNQHVTPAALLDLRAPDGRRVTTALLERLLPHRRQRDGLVKLSLARSRSAAEALAGHLRDQGQAPLDANAAADYLEAHQWQTYPTSDGPLVAQPLLERLLIAEARHTMSVKSWQDAHEFLMQHHLGPDNTAPGHAQWHCMAAGKASTVASGLEELFELGNTQRGGAGEWLTLLAYCATAPVPPAEDDVDERPRIAMGEHDFTMRDAARREAMLPVTRLLHALWCLSEPHTEPDPDLCDAVGEELRSLSRLHSTWRAGLLHAARTWPEAAKRKRPFAAPQAND